MFDVIAPSQLTINKSQCDSESSYCVKRKLLHAITFKILDWLDNNKDQLQDIDYADDDDVYTRKYTVYVRDDSIDENNENMITNVNILINVYYLR